METLENEEKDNIEAEKLKLEQEKEMLDYPLITKYQKYDLLIKNFTSD